MTSGLTNRCRDIEIQTGVDRQKNRLTDRPMKQMGIKRVSVRTSASLLIHLSFL